MGMDLSLGMMGSDLKNLFVVIILVLDLEIYFILEFSKYFFEKCYIINLLISWRII
jgi:hypothetical protein